MVRLFTFLEAAALSSIDMVTCQSGPCQIATYSLAFCLVQRCWIFAFWKLSGSLQRLLHGTYFHNLTLHLRPLVAANTWRTYSSETFCFEYLGCRHIQKQHLLTFLKGCVEICTEALHCIESWELIFQVQQPSWPADYDLMPRLLEALRTVELIKSVLRNLPPGFK
jgi:hypothetical protein